MKIIAELGVNTNGMLITAYKMLDAAKECGCDGVKVQAYETTDMVPVGHPDYDMFEKNRLTWNKIALLRTYAKDLGLLFGATPMSVRGVEFCDSIDVDFLKNGSDCLLRDDLIGAMLETGRETWVSTGMATREEVAGVPEGAKLMACTSLYPCPPEKAGLERLEWADGYSDHTEGVDAARSAAVMSAEMLEKHFTLSRTMDGPDHLWSADPGAMRHLVNEVRYVESMLPYDGSDHVHRDEWRVPVGAQRP